MTECHAKFHLADAQSSAPQLERKAMSETPQRPLRLLSIPEASSHLNIHRGTLYRLIKAGSLPIVKIAGRTLIRPTDLASLIEDNVRSAA
jgi:excisionase family DNA binding protein